MQINMQIDNKEMQNNHKECHKTLMTLENDNDYLKVEGASFLYVRGVSGLFNWYYNDSIWLSCITHKDSLLLLGMWV